MLSTRISGKIMPTRNTPQKINMRVTTSQYETSGKNNAPLLSCNLPAGEKIHWNKQHFGTRYKSFVAYQPPFTHCICEVVTRTAVIFHSRSIL